MSNLTKEQIGLSLVKLIFPLLVIFSVEISYTFIIRWFINLKIGGAGVGVFSLVEHSGHFVNYLLMGVLWAVTIIVGQYTGASKTEKARNAINLSVIMTAALMVFVLLAWFALPLSLKADLFGGNMFKEAQYSLNLYFVGYLFKAGILLACFILYGLDDAVRPMFFMLVLFALKLALSLVFLLGIFNTVESVVWSQFISNLFVFVAICFYLYNTHPFIKPAIKDFSLSAKGLFIYLRIAVPLMLQGIVIFAGTLLISKFTFRLLSADQVGGMAIAESVLTVPWVLINALVVALTIFTAHNSGAGKDSRITIGFVSILILLVGISIFLFGASMILPEEVFSFFGNSIPSQVWAKKELLFITFTLILVVANQCLTAVFKGSGDTIIPFFITIIALFIVQLPINYFVSDIFGEKSIWLGKLMGWLATFVLLIVYFATGWWKKWRLVKHY